MNKYSAGLENVTDNELVAAWNVLQFSQRMICDKSDLPERQEAIAIELKKRGICYEANKKISKISGK